MSQKSALFAVLRADLRYIGSPGCLFVCCQNIRIIYSWPEDDDSINQNSGYPSKIWRQILTSPWKSDARFWAPQKSTKSRFLFAFRSKRPLSLLFPHFFMSQGSYSSRRRKLRYPTFKRTYSYHKYCWMKSGKCQVSISIEDDVRYQTVSSPLLPVLSVKCQ